MPLNPTAIHYVIIGAGTIAAAATFLHTNLTGEAGVVAGTIAQLCAMVGALLTPSMLKKDGGK